MAYLVDTWLWVEYLQGSEAPRLTRTAIEERTTATGIVTLAELSDRDHREGRAGTAARAAFIEANSRLLPVTPHAALRAGVSKWAQRDRGKPLGISEAVIYETAREAGLTIVTGDPGFEGLKGVELVPRRPRR